MISARNITTRKEIGAIRYRNDVNALKEIAFVRGRDAANVLREYYSVGGGMAVNVPAFAYGAQSSSSSVDVTTELVTATPVGGVAPYTFLWTRTDANPGVWVIVFSTSASTSFRAESVPAADSKLATFKCTVTDARGVAVDSIDINATAENFGGFV